MYCYRIGTYSGCKKNQTTPTKQDLSTSLGLFSKLPTITIVLLMWESPYPRGKRYKTNSNKPKKQTLASFYRSSGERENRATVKHCYQEALIIPSWGIPGVNFKFSQLLHNMVSLGVCFQREQQINGNKSTFWREIPLYAANI